jgi:hypothetical protein
MSLSKSCILSAIQYHLYNNIKEKLAVMYREIQISHQRLTENSLGGFWFNGMRYQSGLKGAAQSLHPALSEFMQDYESQSQELITEQGYVVSYIQSVLNQCTESSQLYYYFPSGLRSILRDEGLEETPTSNLSAVPTIDFNQKGKELLLARLMLNMTGT